MGLLPHLAPIAFVKRFGRAFMLPWTLRVCVHVARVHARMRAHTHVCANRTRGKFRLTPRRFASICEQGSYMLLCVFDVRTF